MRRRLGQVTGLLAATAVAMVLSGCAETVEERSFTDRNGRSCTYVLVKESDGDKEVNNLDCDYPTSSPPSPPPSPTPTG